MNYLQFRHIYRNDLFHYGIKRRSGRYPYGSGERPFQSEGTSIRISAKKDEKNGTISEKREKIRSGGEERESVLREIKGYELKQLQNELTNQELRSAIDRVKMKRELSNISKQEFDEGWNSIRSVMKKVGDVKDWVKLGMFFGELLFADLVFSGSGNIKHKKR